MAYRIVNEVDAVQSQQGMADGQKGGGGGSVSAKSGGGTAAAGEGGSASAGGKRMDEEEERDAVFYRLESLGYRVGQGLVERYEVLS